MEGREGEGEGRGGEGEGRGKDISNQQYCRFAGRP